MRGAEHHVRYAGDALGPKDVVLDDGGIRACGERSTTSGTSAAPWGLKTWCSSTKGQGLAGSGAPRPVRRRPGNSKPLARARRRGPRRQSLPLSRRPHHSAEHRPAAGGLSGRQPPTKKDRRTVGPPNFLNFPDSPTSPSGFSWSSSWIAASSGFWHVPARSGRSAAGPWNRTGSSNSCCGLGSAPR